MANTSIAKTVANSVPEVKAQQSVNAILNSILDGDKMRKRFDELLGKRAPQFISSLVSMINDDRNLQECFFQDPLSVVKSALQAASYDLPIDPSLGFAYIVPFNNRVKDERGNWVSKKQATMIIGYKGMTQLCLRTGAYSRIPDAVDVREGELVSYDRLTGDAVFKWIEDEEEREKLPVIGYAGYFRLNNGAEKTIYMTKKQIQAHEQKNRKGSQMGKGWREDFDSMARKTVIRRLCSKYALMSIEYQDTASKAAMNLASALAASDYPETPADDLVTVEDTTPAEPAKPALPEQSSLIPDDFGYPDFLMEGETDDR